MSAKIYIFAPNTTTIAKIKNAKIFLKKSHMVISRSTTMGGSRGGVMGVATPPFGLGPDHFISSAAASIAKDKSC